MNAWTLEGSRCCRQENVTGEQRAGEEVSEVPGPRQPPCAAQVVEQRAKAELDHSAYDRLFGHHLFDVKVV